MIFIRNMTCYAQHRSKGIHLYNKVLIVHYSCYHGYRKKEQLNSSVSRDSRLSRLYRGVQLYPHGRTRQTSISCAREIRVASCLQPFPNPTQCHMKGSSGCPVNVPDIPDQRHPLASFTDKQVTTSYLAYRPHLRHVVYMSG
jgi:hypothetical protein